MNLNDTGFQFRGLDSYNSSPMSDISCSSPLEETVVIVGVGMIGGSIAAAIKRRKVANCVIGVGRDSSRIEAAREAGLIDEAVTDLSTVLSRADLVVFCTPVEHLAAEVQTAATLLRNTEPDPTTHRSGRAPLLTDVGSVKGPICRQLQSIPQFIGSHPIAGSHRQGFEAANARLFDDRICIVTPLAESAPPAVDRLEQFWQAIGMKTVQMSPDAHDAALAMTSHLPHVVASALATTLTDENQLLTGSGFRDTTRIAAGDPGLWTGILLSNAEQVMRGIDEVQTRLAEFRAALACLDATETCRLLALGQKTRKRLDETRNSTT